MRYRWVAGLLLVACENPPRTAGVTYVPAPPSTEMSPPSDGVTPVPSGSVAARLDAKEIPEPKGECVIDADAPTSKPGTTVQPGIQRVWVEGAVVANVNMLGDVRHARIAIAEGKPDVASIAIDADVFTVRGSTLLHSKEYGEELDLHPRKRVLRDGWLEYKLVGVASVKGTQLEPQTAFDLGITTPPSYGAVPFYVSCADLSPFGALAEESADVLVKGTKVAFEDDAGKKVLSVDRPNEGLAAHVLTTKGGRTKVRFESSRRTAAEVWISSAQVKRATFATLSGSLGRQQTVGHTSMTCSVETPVYARVGGVTYAWATLHAGKEVKGHRAEDGSFAMPLGGKPENFPFVPADRTASCRVVEPLAL